MPEHEPTYEELRAERAREWQAAQAKAAAQLRELNASLLSMPDVKNAPRPDEPWSHPSIACGCGKATFLVPRWVTVNGHRHRAELVCQACQRVGTWDWADMRWIA